MSVTAREFVPPVHMWNDTEGSELKWIRNDQIFVQPESRYEVKTVDIAGNFWEYNAEKTFYQMLLGGVDYLLLGRTFVNLTRGAAKNPYLRENLRR